MRLRKRDVEALLAAYDRDPIGALTAALRRALDRPQDSWAELLATAPITDERRDALTRAEPPALDELAAELNELRQLGDGGYASRTSPMTGCAILRR